GMILIGSELGIIAMNGYMQGNTDIPALLTTINKWLPAARDVACAIGMLGFPTIARLSKRKLAWLMYAVCCSVSLTSNWQWTHATTINANIERTAALNKKLLADPATALLAETYNRAVENLERIKADEPIRCTIPDSTACKRYKNETLPSVSAGLNFTQNQR